MTFALLPGDKFAALALRNASTEYFARKLELDLGDGLWAVNTAPVDVGATWREWIGSIHAREIADSNLWLVAKKPSQTPDILDQENHDLRAIVWQWFMGLLLIGSPSYDGSYLLDGAHSSRGQEIRQYSPVQQCLVSEGPTHLTVAEAHLRLGRRIGASLSGVFASGRHLRVRRGLRVFFDGLQSTITVARLHHSIRSIEALVNPRIARTKRDMIHRCQTFTGRSAAAADVLEDCYELRSREEHLWDWEDALSSVTSVKDKHTTMIRRVRQGEALARYVYARILTSASHMADFADSGIDRFWALPEHVRLARWGAPLDITGVR